MSTPSPDKSRCPVCGGYGYHTMPSGTACMECGADIPGDFDFSSPEAFARQMANTPCGHGWFNMTQARVPYVCDLCKGAGILPANMQPVNLDGAARFRYCVTSTARQRWYLAMRDPDNPIQESPQLQRLLRY
jgi:hypothetical protein